MYIITNLYNQVTMFSNIMKILQTFSEKWLNFLNWSIFLSNACATFTSDPAPCRLMLSRLHGKQNLWWGTDGHCTKWVSSSRSWHRVHLRVAAVGAAGATPSAGATSVVPSAPAADSLDVTVVDDTCLEPDDRLPLELAETITKNLGYFHGFFHLNGVGKLYQTHMWAIFSKYILSLIV